MSLYDLIVIGGGPGGYVAAIRAAQLGLKVACIEGRGTLGGTCLNVGCIPSKAMLSSSGKYESLSHLAGHGIAIDGARLDLDAMMARKDKIVGDLTKGIAFLFKKNGVDLIEGWASIPAVGKVKVGDEIHETKNILIASGSEPTPLPGVDIDEGDVVSSTGALTLPEVPKHLVVVGAGVIGLELGQVWSRLGAKVTVVEYLDRILPGIDGEIAKLAQRALSKRGLKFQLGRALKFIDRGEEGLTLTLDRVGKDKEEQLVADKVLIAIGRRPVIRGLGLEALGVSVNARGFVEVDERFSTSVEGIYAIGDCVPGPMLAHKAEEDGVACVEMLAGQAGHVDYNTVPGIVYTDPEVASVGKTEEALKEAGTDYIVGKFTFMANSRARAQGETDGAVKVLATPEGQILGAHICGAHGGDLIAELVLAMTKGATVGEVAATCHAHPAMAEAVKEACLDAMGRAIHA
ncbi:dihydrolipoyl dehydrogenase [Phaeobacter gallaeciensis]|uniref:Dihydrolipoyl dehydrogenase n=1 Tax=Phaeobacter gallaeciensis TaxID=60890 RepID=A0AAD0EF30_9RHOB|nr:dihydrolipoyl dehydrogenase [Phaeobacter gallaeciensis]AHD11961.1 dihydrolipoamide dehydrogenase [Phaeobacter gallaeciensis DSM 26640]ATE95227.1 dihydrolipoyl dehydrogenase LpdA [Phaeobacter gallaeciensis]ATE99618.1 dihydrolipoyl dehydrogenase LpdA [Phaeobacter gallaeciensis]ATF03932.1 dihydrolipoyl dehydrogenase LpdA [Phaeobacter gallaeciensis]ATF08208.1 dihydrolipoyl dehydrogenase LpdA [Phaeobacter gallaeciensis]